MKEIKRYDTNDEMLPPHTSKSGQWCRWSDVEALQKELEDVRAKALAAVWLLPDDVNVGELQTKFEEASELFLGKDKRTIAKLQDEVARLQEYVHRIEKPPEPGVNAVYGVRVGEGLRCVLMITNLRRGSNGGLEIEVRIP